MRVKSARVYCLVSRVVLRLQRVDVSVVDVWPHGIADRVVAIDFGVVKGTDPEMLPEGFQVPVEIMDVSDGLVIFRNQSKSACILGDLSDRLLDRTVGHEASARLGNATFDRGDAGYS